METFTVEIFDIHNPSVDLVNVTANTLEEAYWSADAETPWRYRRMLIKEADGGWAEIYRGGLLAACYVPGRKK